MSGIGIGTGLQNTGTADTFTGVLPAANGGAITSNQLSVYAAGTAYQLTATPAAVIFGTSSPSLTINAAGTYLIMARAKLNYTGATFAAVRTTALKLRRTNNTAADLTNGSVAASTAIITALTFSFIDQCWQIIYTTTNTNDIISLFGSIDIIPSLGSIDVGEASIIAIRLQV